jgi:hypothetical protein
MSEKFDHWLMSCEQLLHTLYEETLSLAEASDEMPKGSEALAKAVQRMTQMFGKTVGPILSEMSGMGTIVLEGQSNPYDKTRLYVLCLATNDAGAMLKDWAMEQAQGRLEAAKKAGHKYAFECDDDQS